MFILTKYYCTYTVIYICLKKYKLRISSKYVWYNFVCWYLLCLFTNVTWLYRIKYILINIRINMTN